MERYSDDELIARVLAVLEGGHEVDGMHLRPGLGSQYWITGTEIGDDEGTRVLLIRLATPAGPAAPARVAFEREVFEEESADDEADELAIEAGLQISQLMYDLLDPVPHVDSAAVAAELGSPELVYTQLIASFEGRAERVDEDCFRVEDGGESFEVRVGPQAFFDLVVRQEVAYRRSNPLEQEEMPNGLGMVMTFLDETIGPALDDERFIVLHDGEFCASTRAELPPVPGSRPTMPSGGQWYAVNPDGTREPFSDDD